MVCAESRGRFRPEVSPLVDVNLVRCLKHRIFECAYEMKIIFVAYEKVFQIIPDASSGGMPCY